MSIQIREYVSSDRNACLDAFISNVPQFFTKDEIADFESFLVRIEEQQRREKIGRKTYFFVLLYDGRVVGCGGFGDKDGDNIISLAWGLIHRDFHRRGLGRELLTYRLKEIHRLYPSLPVVIDTTQFSFPFFQKFGFVTQKVTSDYYAPGMDRYDMMLQN